jgi:hypothetical protein
MAQMAAQAKQRRVTLEEVLMHQPNAMSVARGEQTARSLLQPMPLIVLSHPKGVETRSTSRLRKVGARNPYTRRLHEANYTPRSINCKQDPNGLGVYRCKMPGGYFATIQDPMLAPPVMPTTCTYANNSE